MKYTSHLKDAIFSLNLLFNKIKPALFKVLALFYLVHLSVFYNISIILEYSICSIYIFYIL